MTLSPDMLGKLEAHRILAAKLKEVKEEEMDLRRDICADLLDGEPVGLKKITDGGLLIKVTKKIQLKIDEDELSDVYDDMSVEEQACIKYTPSIIKKAYDAIGSSPMLEDVITVVEATPALSVELTA